MNSISAPREAHPQSLSPSASPWRRLAPTLLPVAALLWLLVALTGCAALPSDPYPPPVAVKLIQVHTYDPARNPYDPPDYYVLQRVDTGEKWAVTGVPTAKPGEVYSMRL